MSVVNVITDIMLTLLKIVVVVIILVKIALVVAQQNALSVHKIKY